MTKEAMLSDLRDYFNLQKMEKRSLRDTLTVYLNTECTKMPFREFIKLYRLVNSNSENEKLLTLNIIYKKVFNEKL